MTSISKKPLALKEKRNQEKLRNQAMKMGVTLKSPETVFLSNDTKFGKNVIINPYVVIGKKTKIGNNVEILSFTHIENAILESNVSIGPFSRIRPGTKLSSGSKVGNFVEVKKSKIGKNTKINHLSYIGDAKIGKNVNVGAGTITCNYDGKKKNKVTILDDAFIGSNTSLIAPVKIGKKSMIGAGSAISANVKDKSLALTRSKQISIKNYKRK
ncbi:MAG: bifunctional UDP-N-acetylglucosamine pyrophosphorylase / Glucosamine-1-phosphate N-acetyltransferase [Pelagibacterales bacterium]|nr:bifunctional UDP-N-acetylglucosamine pyrophosphorylase / Glucosamine-1-phosphate N-acetyltransferase [Pelagibacterales bacterium]